MNSEEIKKEMKRIDKMADHPKWGFDREQWHMDADALLINVLKDLGYDELCKWWEEMFKWFA